MSGRSWWTRSNYGSSIGTVRAIRDALPRKYVRSIVMNGMTGDPGGPVDRHERGQEEVCPVHRHEPNDRGREVCPGHRYERNDRRKYVRTVGMNGRSVRTIGRNGTTGGSMSGRSAWTGDQERSCGGGGGESMSGRSVWGARSAAVRGVTKYVRSIGSAGPAARAGVGARKYVRDIGTGPPRPRTGRGGAGRNYVRSIATPGEGRRPRTRPAARGTAGRDESSRSIEPARAAGFRGTGAWAALPSEKT